MQELKFEIIDGSKPVSLVGEIWNGNIEDFKVWIVVINQDGTEEIIADDN